MTAPPFRFAALVAVPLTLATCGQPSPDAAVAPSSDAAPISPVDDLRPASPANDVSSVPVSTALPQPFRGRWDSSAAACAGRRGEMRLEVEADRLRFYESEAQVQAVRAGTGDSAEVDLAFEGEGERWTETRRLRLLPDGRLSVETSEGSAQRVRCG